MLVRNFFGKPLKKYQDFDFKPLKILKLLHNTIKNTEFPFRLQKDMLDKSPGKNHLVEQPDHSLTNNFFQFTENFSETFHFYSIWKLSRPLKNSRISFLSKIFWKTLKIPKSEFYTLKIQQAYL